jgi:DNA-binding NtrC family response regulator
MLSLPRVLLLTCDQSERMALERILNPYADLVSVCSQEEMESALETAEFDAVLSARLLCTSGWSDVVEAVGRRCPDVPVIVLSRTAGEQEWVEVLDAGAFDLLGPPYYDRTVLPVLEHAVVSHAGRVSRHMMEAPPKRAAS